MTEQSLPQGGAPHVIDTQVAHPARIWNYWLGGKDYYEADRQVGDDTLAVYPEIVHIARHQRAFLGRSISHMAREEGIRQFLDIGTGLPTVDNTHEVAQRIAPESRIVYVDNDPLVLAHARALLTSTPQGATDYIDADIRDPERILEGAAQVLDFTRPVGLTLLGILIFLEDDAEVRAILERLLRELPSGSHVALTHTTNVVHGRRTDDAVAVWNEGGSVPMTIRSPERLAELLSGLAEPLEPGIVLLGRWRPEPDPFGEPPELDELSVVARKP